MENRADLFAFIGAYTASALHAAPTASVKWGLVGQNLVVTVRMGQARKTSVFELRAVALAAVMHQVELDAREAAIEDVDVLRRRASAEARP